MNSIGRFSSFGGSRYGKNSDPEEGKRHSEDAGALSRGISRSTLAGIYFIKYYNIAHDWTMLHKEVRDRSGAIDLDGLVSALGRIGILFSEAAARPDTLNRGNMPAILEFEDGGILILHGSVGDGNKLLVIDPLNDMGVSAIPAGQLNFRSIKRLLVSYLDERIVGAREEKNNGGVREVFIDAIRGSSGAYLTAIASSILINLLALALPIFIMVVYDRVIPTGSVETLVALSFGIFVLACFEFLFRILRSQVLEKAGLRFEWMVGTRVLDSILSPRPGQRPLQKEHIIGIARDIERSRSFFSSATLVYLGDVPFIILFVGLIWLIAGQLAFVPLISIPIIIACGLIIQIPINRASERASRSAKSKGRFLREISNGLDTLIGNSAQEWAEKGWGRSNYDAADQERTVNVLTSLSVNIATFFQTLTTVAIVALAVGMIDSGELTMGALIASMILNGRIASPLIQVAQLMGRISSARQAARSLAVAFEKVPGSDAGSDGQLRPMLSGGLGLRDVSFRYQPDGPPILSHVTVSIKPGERVALVGPPGAGKSTALRMLSGMLLPSEGSVVFDGTNVTQFAPGVIRRQVGYLPQCFNFFQGSIGENIILGRDHLVSDQDVQDAAWKSGFDVVFGHDKSYLSQPVGVDGGTLSGGAKQVVGLARALVCRPKVLLLDEPTNHLDDTTERAIVERLSQSAPGTTVVVVSHRRRVIDMADRVVFLTDGKVMFDGPRVEFLQMLDAGASKVEDR